MSPARHTPCDREDDVLDLVAIGQWPPKDDADLAAHVARCRSCSELVAASGAIVALREGTDHPVPDASVVWQRAQMRAREDAARRAVLPLNFAAGCAAAALGGLALAWSALGSAWITSWWNGLASLVSVDLPSVEAPQLAELTSIYGLPLVAIGLVASLLLVPLAFWLARIADRG